MLAPAPIEEHLQKRAQDIAVKCVEAVDGVGVFGVEMFLTTDDQIVFNEISAAEISQLDTLEQLELLDEFKVTRDDLEHFEDERFGKIERDGKTLSQFDPRRHYEWFG
mgnify:CR=1 FL=1